MMTSDPADTIKFDASVAEMKLVYRVLHSNLSQHIELMDCDFLDHLQSELQQRARADGVDIGDHAAWDEWLGNRDAPSCTERLAQRRVIPTDSPAGDR
ncbi:MAG: hypothetical protein AAGC55_15375 [Myxococcota bacterium]